MAFLLRSSATNQRVTLPAITVLSAIGDKVVLDAQRVGAADVILASSSAAMLSNPGGSAIRWRVTSSTGGVEFVNSTSWQNARCTITLERLADNNVSISIPELGYSDVKLRGGIISIAQIFSLNGNFGCVLDFYSLKIYNSAGTLLHHYDPSASNGTGTTLIDTVGGNNGTLVNFPTDNSQWVFYDAGGAANKSTVGYDLGAIGFAVSSQTTAPAITAAVSYDIGAIGYAVSAQQFAPGNNASLSYDIGAISYAVSAQQSAPQFSASVGYEIGGIGFAVQANTGTPVNTATAAYDLGSIGYSVSAQSVAPQLSASLAYDIGAINYTISANTGTPIRAATIGYDIGDISWQVSAQWQPSDALAIIGYDIGSIGFLVQARSGDVVVSSSSDAGLSFKELARGLSFKEQPRGIKFTEPQRGVRV